MQRLSLLSHRTFLLAADLAWTAGSLAAQAPEPASCVNPLIGTGPNPIVKIGYAFDTGNVFPGAVCPRGIVAWSPDTTHKNNIAGGYWYPDDKIEDFSLTHFSGRGVPCLKDVAFAPLVKPVGASPGTAWETYASTFSHANESAHAGDYRVKFDNGLLTELTATPRTGMARFTFPAGASATLLLRANGAVSVNGSEASGHADSHVGKGGAYKVYFFARFSRPVTSVRTWVGEAISDESHAEGPNSGAVLGFDAAADPVLLVRVGISYTSLDNARDNLKQENEGQDFAAVQKNAAAAWNRDLGRIEVEGGSTEQREVFYTALYHCFIHPNLLDDANGEYLGMDARVHTVATGHHQYQNIPAWDEHRSHSPLMAILAPRESSDVMQSLVNYSRQDASVRPTGGGLPRWEQVNRNSGGMVGDGDDTIIAGTYAFRATGFDASGAWEAMDKGASQPGVTSDGAKVRGGLEEYISKGYVPENSAVTLEYCADDFALSRFADSLGYREKAAAYLRRAQNWKNLFDPATGYIRPRTADGAWMENFSPRNGKGFIEGSAAQYLWLVNFNLKGLIDKLGGNQKTVERLDHFFTKTNAGMSSEFAYMGNEPDEEAPWVYDFASAPARTQEVVRRIQTELFTATPGGLPGNDDAGSLSSWYVFSALGLYPEIPGVAGFAVGSPVFPRATLHLDDGRIIQIIGNNAAPAACFVQGMTLNGQPYQSPWIPWSRLFKGGIVAFDLGEKPTAWGTDPKSAPPSFDGDEVPAEKRN